jgi:hypothetical protein
MRLSLSVVLHRGTWQSLFPKNNVAQSLFHPHGAGLLSWGHLDFLQNSFYCIDVVCASLVATNFYFFAASITKPNRFLSCNLP